MQLLDGKYQIEQLLGEGGMGAVYRATHLGTKRTVAVKVIHPQLSTHDQFIARFRREAEAAGRLRHPNVVDVTDFGFAETTNGPVAYLVMEYLDGCTLADQRGYRRFETTLASLRAHVAARDDADSFRLNPLHHPRFAVRVRLLDVRSFRVIPVA